MTEEFDSYNCVDIVIDDSTIPPSPPTPLTPEQRERLRKERERLRRYGYPLLPPEPETPPGSTPAG